MAVQPQYLAYVLEQLEGLGTVRPRRMFGGVGLYGDGLFFGLIDDDTVYFKSDASNAADYTARNMPRFMPFPDRPEAVLAYYQVPADIIEDAEAFVAWARKSVAVALASQAAKARRAARPKRVAKPRAKTVKPAKAVKTAKVTKGSRARARATPRRPDGGKARAKMRRTARRR
jgi:DNA transformation protein and related proteins